jgi:hypothetical protein
VLCCADVLMLNGINNTTTQVRSTNLKDFIGNGNLFMDRYKITVSQLFDESYDKKEHKQ